uniref:Uncharacterized protein n=1 Tax=Chrysotila carterae TaxID=13221 RepID=A0A7S4C309_CHRCT
MSSAMAPPRTQKLILVLATLPGTATLLIPLRAVPSSSLILSRLGTQRSRVFLPRVGNSQGRGSAVRLALAESGKGGVRSLSPACEWRLQLRLFPPTKEGAADSEAPRAEDYEVVTATVRFALDEGYEPPQGLIRVESCLPEGALKLGEMPTRWMLSEDPDDRKDSLWIWGLFKEPLYPFILFQLECSEIALPTGVAIPAGRLYIQADHRRSPTEGVRLGDGKVSYRVAQQLEADLVGLSDFTYNEPIICGTSRFLDGM